MSGQPSGLNARRISFTDKIIRVVRALCIRRLADRYRDHFECLENDNVVVAGEE